MTIALVIVTVFFASFATGLTGFGFGLISMGVLPYVMSVSEANGIVAIVATITAVVAFIPVRKSAQLGRLWPIYLGAAVGVPLGVFYLVELNESVLRITLGVVILLAIVATSRAGARAEEKGARATEPRGLRARLIAAGTGLASGSLGGAFSVGGPPVVVYFNATLIDKTEIKAHLLGYFMFSLTVRAPLLIATGVIDVDAAMSAAIALPALAVGTFVGHKLHDRLPTRIVRIIIQVLLAVSAVSLIIDGL
jgi:hypothetical protein